MGDIITDLDQQDILKQSECHDDIIEPGMFILM